MQDLRESERFARNMLDSLVCFVAVCTPDGVVVEANRLALTVAGLCPEDVLGKPVEETYWWSHDVDTQQQLRAAIAKATNEELSRYDVVIRAAEGMPITVDFQIVPLKNEQGEVTHLVLSGIDVTERCEYERQLQSAKEQAEQANVAKSQFLASMSHELRTPLNGVLGMAELLTGTDLCDKQQKYVTACRNSGESLLSLINDILDFSKIEAGRMELDLHAFDLETLVADTVETMAWRAADKNIEMLCYVDQISRFTLEGDGNRLRQVLVNLLSNGIKFTDEGEVVLRTEIADRRDDQIRVRFTISDTGIGIPADKLDRLFESFSQVDASTTRKYGGSGLGLAISQSLLQLMDGTLAVESEAGKGSTFSFELPFEVLSESTDAQSDVSPLAEYRALIVDDNHTNRSILKEYANDWGLTSVVTAGVDEALAAVAAAETDNLPFHFVLCDYDMPGRNGIELANALSDRPPRVVLLPSSTEVHLNPRELRDHGIAALLRKPLRRRELHHVLCELLDIESRTTEEKTDEPAAPAFTLERSLNILLAEDNRINQMYIIELMDQIGCTCETVANGREVVEAVQQGKYSLVLMDCQMPEMDGFEATRQIRRLEADGLLDGHLPIVALTANAVKGDRERCLEAGMDEYLAKPVQKQQVIAVLEQLLADSPERSVDAEAAADSPEDTNDCSETASIDAEGLLARCFGNLEFADSLLEELESTGWTRVEEIRKQTAEQDPAGIAEAAHTLKGAAGILCAGSLQDLAAQIEVAGRSSELAGVDSLIGDLTDEMQRCLDGLPGLRDELRVAKTGSQS